VDGAGDRMWTQVHSLWKNLGTTVYDAVGDTPGRRVSVRADQGRRRPQGVDEKKFRDDGGGRHP
jgi:hypothetical protein